MSRPKRPALQPSGVQPPQSYPSRELLGRFWRGYLRPHLGLMLVAFALLSLEGSTLGLLSYMIQAWPLKLATTPWLISQ